MENVRRKFLYLAFDDQNNTSETPCIDNLSGLNYCIYYTIFSKIVKSIILYSNFYTKD